MAHVQHCELLKIGFIVTRQCFVSLSLAFVLCESIAEDPASDAAVDAAPSSSTAAASSTQPGSDEVGAYSWYSQQHYDNMTQVVGKD
eukprot:635935-Amphidinium_carterae.3